MIKLTIIIPVYNEIKTFEKLLNQVIRLNFRKQIIVVDDCSTDGTKKYFSKEKKNKIDKVIFHKKNMGKGGLNKKCSKIY